MPVLATLRTLVVLGHPVFDKGYIFGRSWFFHGDTPGKPVTWEDVVHFIKDNIIDPEFTMTDERMIGNLGHNRGVSQNAYS